MPRYAVIGALDAKSLPIGLVVEDEGCVRIEALDEYRLPELITEPYRVLQRDLSEVVYKPGDTGYFDQVLVELSRLVSIGEQDSISIPSEAALLSLFAEKVLKPRFREATRGNYSGSHGRESVFRPRLATTGLRQGDKNLPKPRLTFRVAA